MKNSLKQRKELEYKVLKLAEKDKNFRKKLVENPKAAVEQLGLKFPKEFQLKIIQEKKGEKILVIPEVPVENELSDLQMIGVAGGKNYQPHPRVPPL